MALRVFWWVKLDRFRRFGLEILVDLRCPGVRFSAMLSGWTFPTL